MAKQSPAIVQRSRAAVVFEVSISSFVNPSRTFAHRLAARSADVEWYMIMLIYNDNANARI